MTIWGIAMCIRNPYWHGFKNNYGGVRYNRTMSVAYLNMIKRNPAAKKNNTTT